MDIRIQEEIAHAESVGMKRLTMRQAIADLKAMGYKLRTHTKCQCVARYVAGPRAGKTYPCTTISLTHIASGMDYAHVDTPKDRLPELQKWRNWHYVVLKDSILNF